MSCNRKYLSNKGTIDTATKQMLLSYLKQHKAIDTNASLFIDTLIKKSNWKNTTQSVISNLVTLYYVPLNYKTNKTGITFMYNNNSKKVYYGLITEFPQITNHANKLIQKNPYTPTEIITGFYNYKMKNYSGSIRAYSLSNNFYWEFGYENGQRKFEKRITSYDPSDTTTNMLSNKENVLIKWHLVTVYVDGKYDWRYIGTTKENDSCQMSIGLTQDSVRIKLNCSGKSGFL